MSVLDSNFATRDFYSKGIIRFEEISARRKADIDTFKTVITNPKVEINEKYKMPFHFLSRNSSCRMKSILNMWKVGIITKYYQQY